MARLWMDGFEQSSSSISGKSSTPEAARGGFRRRGRGMRFVRTVLQIPEEQQLGAAVATLGDRWYFCPRRFPSSGATRVWSHLDSGFSGANVRAWLTSAGALSFRNSADVEFLSMPMTIGAWVRIDTLVARGGAPNVQIARDGVTLYNANPGGTLTGTSLGNRIGPPAGAGGDSEWDVDDWSGDDAAMPGAGRIRVLSPTGAGTYAAWTNSDWRAHRDISVANLGSPQQARGAAAGDRMSFVFDVSSVGVVKGYRIGVNSMSTGQTLDYFIRINGVDTTVWSGIATSTSAGLQQRISGIIATPLFSASDTVEIGVRVATGTNADIKGMFLIVEDDGLWPALALDEADPIVRIAVGSFAGSASLQEVTPFGPGVDPDLVLVWGHTSTLGRAAAWMVTHNEDGGRPVDFQNNATNIVGHFAMKAGVLLLPGGSNVNSSGQTYGYLAIRDRTFQMFYPSARPVLATEGADDITVPFPDQAGFDPDFLMTLIAQISGNGMIRDSAHVGDQSNNLTNGLVSDAIQTMAAGAFQVGTSLVGATSAGLQTMALKTAPAVANLFGMLSWVGTGTNPRSLPYPDGMSSPDLIIVVPHTANGAFVRSAYMRSRFMSNAQQLSGSTAASTITSIDAGTFTVDTDGNRSGVTYMGLFFKTGASGEFEFPLDPFGATVPLVWAEAFLET